MADRTIYLVSVNTVYLTNKTNATRLWEVFEERWGDKPLEFRYQEDESHTEYTSTPARVHKLKKLCQTAIKNRIIVNPVGDRDDIISVIQDVVGGKS